MADFIEHTCGDCGCVWGFPRALHDQRKKDGKSFYCPNGHGRHFVLGQTEEDKLRRQLDDERRRRQSAEQNTAYYQDEAKRERNRANGYKGHATRMTKRAQAGVCPCCNRTFQQLARHMASQHPEFTPIDIDQVPEGATVQ